MAAGWAAHLGRAYTQLQVLATRTLQRLPQGTADQCLPYEKRSPFDSLGEAMNSIVGFCKNVQRSPTLAMLPPDDRAFFNLGVRAFGKTDWQRRAACPSQPASN